MKVLENIEARSLAFFGHPECNTIGISLFLNSFDVCIPYCFEGKIFNDHLAHISHDIFHWTTKSFVFFKDIDTKFVTYKYKYYLFK